jgi:tetratricopeptide (TPR) repeat protein
MNIKIKIAVFLAVVSTGLFADIKIPATQEKLVEAIKNEKSKGEITQKLVVFEMLNEMQFEDDKDETKKKLKALKKMLKSMKKTDKNYTEMSVIRGSATMSLAKFERSVGKRLLWVRKGSIIMDKAIKKDPTNIYGLIQRAKVSLNLPLNMRRIRFVYSDYDNVRKIVELQISKSKKQTSKEKKEFDILLGMIYHDKALAYKKEGDIKKAIAEFKKSIALKAGYWSNISKVELEKIN